MSLSTSFISFEALIISANASSMVSPNSTIRVTEKAPLGELYRSRGGQYDVYQGGVSFDEVLRVELKFLRRHAKNERAASDNI
jgi:hypothetical protein